MAIDQPNSGQGERGPIRVRYCAMGDTAIEWIVRRSSEVDRTDKLHEAIAIPGGVWTVGDVLKTAMKRAYGDESTWSVKTIPENIYRSVNEDVIDKYKSFSQQQETQLESQETEEFFGELYKEHCPGLHKLRESILDMTKTLSVFCEKTAKEALDIIEQARDFAEFERRSKSDQKKLDDLKGEINAFVGFLSKHDLTELANQDEIYPPSTPAGQRMIKAIASGITFDEVLDTLLTTNSARMAVQASRHTIWQAGKYDLPPDYLTDLFFDKNDEAIKAEKVWRLNRTGPTVMDRGATGPESQADPPAKEQSLSEKIAIEHKAEWDQFAAGSKPELAIKNDGVVPILIFYDLGHDSMSRYGKNDLIKILEELVEAGGLVILVVADADQYKGKDSAPDLWKLLLRYARDQTLAIVSGNVLRSLSCGIDHKTTWEQTIQSVQSQFRSGPSEQVPAIQVLSQFKQVVMRIGVVGGIHCMRDRLVQEPDNEANEGAVNEQEVPYGDIVMHGLPYYFYREPDKMGSVLGLTSIYASSIAIAIGKEIVKNSDEPDAYLSPRRIDQYTDVICDAVQDAVVECFRHYTTGMPVPLFDDDEKVRKAENVRKWTKDAGLFEWLDVTPSADADDEKDLGEQALNEAIDESQDADTSGTSDTKRGENNG